MLLIKMNVTNKISPYFHLLHGRFKKTGSSTSKSYYQSQLPILPARGRAAKRPGKQRGAAKVRVFRLCNCCISVWHRNRKKSLTAWDTACSGSDVSTKFCLLLSWEIECDHPSKDQQSSNKNWMWSRKNHRMCFTSCSFCNLPWMRD